MKKRTLVLTFMLFSVFTLTAEENDECFDSAIASLELSEEKYGMMSDEDATNYLNYAYANCVSWMASR